TMPVRPPEPVTGVPIQVGVPSSVWAEAGWSRMCRACPPFRSTECPDPSWCSRLTHCTVWPGTPPSKSTTTRSNAACRPNRTPVTRAVPTSSRSARTGAVPVGRGAGVAVLGSMAGPGVVAVPVEGSAGGAVPQEIRAAPHARNAAAARTNGVLCSGCPAGACPTPRLLDRHQAARRSGRPRYVRRFPLIGRDRKCRLRYVDVAHSLRQAHDGLQEDRLPVRPGAGAAVDYTVGSTKSDHLAQYAFIGF